jgi:hypothetical protein
VARQGYGNASFEVGGEEGLDNVEEPHIDETRSEQKLGSGKWGKIR